jgi:hypothetical protein
MAQLPTPKIQVTTNVAIWFIYLTFDNVPFTVLDGQQRLFQDFLVDVETSKLCSTQAALPFALHLLPSSVVRPLVLLTSVVSSFLPGNSTFAKQVLFAPQRRSSSWPKTMISKALTEIQSLLSC